MPSLILALVLAGGLSVWTSGCGSDKTTNPPAQHGVDLLVVTAGFSDSLPLVGPGDRVDLPDWLAENAGDTPSGGFAIGIYLSVDEQITTADALVDTLPCPGLVVGGDFQLPDSVTIPPIASGAYFLGVLLDLNQLGGSIPPLYTLPRWSPVLAPNG